MYFLVNSLSLVFLPHEGFKRLKWDISRITIAFWKISSEHIRLSLRWIQLNYFQPWQNDSFHRSSLSNAHNQGLESAKKDFQPSEIWPFLMHVWYWLVCIYLFIFFCFWQWGEWVEETVDGESNVLKFTLLDRIIWSFSQPNYFLSQIIRWPSFLLAAASMLGGKQTVCTKYIFFFKNGFFFLKCLSYNCPSKCEIPTKWTISSSQTR